MELPPSLESGGETSVDPLTASRNSRKQLSVADHNPGGYDPLNLTVSKTKTFRVLVKTPTQALMIVRFLLAKVIHQRDFRLTDAEELLMLEAWEILGSVKDQSFKAKYNKIVSNLRYVELSRRGTTLNPNIDHTQWWKMLARLEGIPSSHAFFGWWKTFRIKDWFRIRNRALESKSSQKRFIGVGYQDHGTARDVAFDGSPRWQEVVGARLFLSAEKEEPLCSPFLGLRPQN